MELLTIGQAREIASAALGKKISLKTVYQWTTKGRRSMRLMYIKAGRSLMVPRRELDIFLSTAFKSSSLKEKRSS